MKAARIIFGLGLGMGLVAMVALEANAQECRADVSKRSFAASTKAERSWDIQFVVAVNGCAAANGTFEYVAQIEVEGKTRLETAKAQFDTENVSGGVLNVLYRGPIGSTLKDVRSIKVTSCSCS
jgi:hypothetical protein